MKEPVEATPWRVMNDEQRLLLVSIYATASLAVIGVIVGVVAGSTAIIFDGIYGLIDAAMTVLALGVARLISASNAADATGGRLTERFTMGFWHLEPIVLGANALMLTGAAIYALINAFTSVLRGGHIPSFDMAVSFAAFVTMADFGMAFYILRANRTVRSQLLALDAKSWIMTASFGAALFIAFLAGLLIQGTRFEWMLPYVDPVALILICIVVIPLPIGTIRQSLSDILLVTPTELKARVDSIASAVVSRYGFTSYRAYVAKVGRGLQIELNLIVPRDWPAKRLEEWDEIRNEIGEAIGDNDPNRWLTIVFTTDPEWAY